ncbi:MAG: hypothetical protein WCL51_15990 [Bacteroidota bacterium]
MKNLRVILVVMIGVVILSSCRKEVVQPTATVATKPQNMNELVASPTFDWKTTKDYQITLSGNYNEVVTVKSASGVVFHKGFMKTATSYKISLTIPASEKTVHLFYHGQDIACPLNQAVINYSFNTKKSV